MKKTSQTSKHVPSAPRQSLDRSKAVRGKYANLLAEGTNVVVLDADLLDSFPDSPSVNRALRAFLAINDQMQSAASPRRRRRMPSTSEGTFDPRVGVSNKPAARRAA
jgi:hypothetical protein